MGLKTKDKAADAPSLLPTLKSVPIPEGCASARPEGSRGSETRYFGLPGGWQLFGPGEPSDQIYFVLSGSLGAFRISRQWQDGAARATSAPVSRWARCR
jgi:CRP-like cAMP-binding protein